MKSRILVVIALSLLVLMACNNSEKKKLPDAATAKAVSPYAPLPSFKTVFSALDQVAVKDISAAVPNSLYKTEQEQYRNAFSLGLLTADATLAAKGRNKAKLTEISTEMMNLATLIGLDQEINQMSDQLKTLIDSGKWEELEDTLDKMKEKVENKLYDKGDMEMYTIMILGGWTEAANRVGTLIDKAFNPESTTVLSQEGTWKMMMGNLKDAKNPKLIETEYYKIALAKAGEMQTIIDANTAGKYSQDQVKQMVKLTDEIKAAFAKK